MSTRIVLSCVLLFMLASCSPASREVEAGQGPPAESLQEEQEVFNFGSVSAGDVIRHVFTLTNTTGQRARIVGVQSACNCTVPEPSKDVLEPQEAIPLPATLHTKGKAGAVSVAFSCTLDSGKTYNFGFEGFVSPKELRPISFGSVKRGSEEVREIHLPCLEGEHLEIRSIKHDTTYFQVVEGTRTATGHLFLVRLTSDIPHGDFQSRLEFETNDAINPIKTAIVSGHVWYPVELESKELALGAVELDGVSSGVARVYSPYGLPVELVEVKQTRGDPVEWSWSKIEPSQADLNINFRGRGSDPIVSAELVIQARAEERLYPLTLEIVGLLNLPAK